MLKSWRLPDGRAASPRSLPWVSLTQSHFLGAVGYPCRVTFISYRIHKILMNSSTLLEQPPSMLMRMIVVYHMGGQQMALL